VLRLLGIATAALLLLGALSACSPACGSGAPDGEAAVAGLISAARDADDPDDLCAFVAPGYSVSDQDLTDLRERYADHPDEALDLVQTGQLGSTAQVTVTDGAFADEFAVTSDSDSRWTVAFGTLFG
jgi:hypothetical protein